VKLAKRYDIAIMSSKGMSVTAARMLADRLCPRVPLLVLYDFDSAGIIINRRYSYSSRPNVIDLGLHYPDINGLSAERTSARERDVGRGGGLAATVCQGRRGRRDAKHP
jgi:hypothetical protein